MIIREQRMHRPVNAKNAYTLKQKEWKDWCTEQKFLDGSIVIDEKLSYFLREFVVKRSRKYKKNKDDASIIPLGRESIIGYVKAVMDLYNSRHSFGTNNNPKARIPKRQIYQDYANAPKWLKRAERYDECIKTYSEVLKEEIRILLIFILKMSFEHNPASTNDLLLLEDERSLKNTAKLDIKQVNVRNYIISIG
ncbi:hypothetical protein INT48_003183 [Thamnidium elegans]|uniref:Uncharacterized protein n=1 Tax=Thamnidium elegans TaxID=101142 RepID=A0A8H7SQL3_9FUNG|nr:hypothetical protein INT48_003183 [Thamnidium elegans]